MKKSVIFSLCGLLSFCAVITANASTCSTHEIAELKRTASGISTTYQEAERLVDPSTYFTNNEVGNEPVYENYFKVIFSNLDSKLYIKVYNDYNDEVKFIRYQDTEDGIYTLDWNNIDKITKFTYEVYSSTETSCPDEKYFTGYVVLPKFNELSDSTMCEGITDFDPCSKYIMVDMDPDEQERKITEYLESKIEKEEKRNKKWYQKIGDLVKENKAIPIAGSIIVIAGVATVVVKNKGKKRKRVK